MSLSEAEIGLLEQELKNNGGKVPKAVNATGLHYGSVLEYLDRKNGIPVRSYAPNPRPELERYVISTKNVRGGWPAFDFSAIEQAKNEYDQGTIEMCQWRDGDLVHLLRIPRKKTAHRGSYFAAIQVV